MTKPKLPNNQNTALIKRLESKYEVLDEESFFKNLVNPSLSKNKPYYGWARYREAYSGELVKELIKRSKLDPKRHFIYDPMSGSGSTQLGALELGFDSIGNDIGS
jgi:DNA modification methylase